MACWVMTSVAVRNSCSFSKLIFEFRTATLVMTMPFGAFYFVQHLGSVQIPMNRGQSSLAGFMDELWKLRVRLSSFYRMQEVG